MKKILYFSRSHKYEFLAAIFALVSTAVAFRYSQNQKTLFLLSIVIIFISLGVIIYLRSRDKDFYFIALTRRKDKDDWIGRGQFDYERTQNCFSITNSDPGYIYPKCLTWSDYKFEFRFKIISDCLGAIVRAVNLSNHAMLQIGLDGVRPHIRINGGWSVWEHKDVGLTFNGKLSRDNWYRCVLSCEKGSINIKIFDEKGGTIIDREWGIPQGNVVFSFRKDEEDVKPVNIPFPINLEYGSVGFRNWGSEKALIRNVLIEKN